MSTIERICAHIASRPEQPAITYRDTVVTYGELGASAGSLARQLRTAGVSPGDRVAVVASRSERMIIAEIACLLLGAAFVPVDRGQPPVRRRALVRGVCPAAVIDCDGGLVDDGYGVPVVGMGARYGGDDAVVAPSRTEPDHPVYLMYTSGTAGRPKAVVIVDRGLENLVTGFIGPLLDEHEVQTVGLLSPFFFDASIKMIYGALATGRTLHVISENERDSVDTLGARLAAARVDALDGTPAYLRALAAYLGSDAPALACILVGGERLAVDLADALATATGASVINVYGPTEVTVDATFHRHEVGAQRLPIGTPIPGVDVRIVRNGRAVATGQPGEIYVGGAGVARGYFDDPELTAERFVTDPFGAGSGRFYRTGDIGRRLRDGTIDYLKRADDQLKVRGHRVEPAEIEQAIMSLHPIEAAGVVSHEQHGSQLIAFCSASAPVDTDAVLRQVARLLPGYMVPSALIEVSALPLTRNGKLDRARLRAMAAESLGRTEQDASAPEPATDAGRALVEAVRHALRLEPGVSVDIRESLLTLGGDSITAILLVAALARSGYRTTVRSILTAPSLAAAAADLEPVVVDAVPAVPQEGPVEQTPVVADFFAREYLHPQHYHQSIALPLEIKDIAYVQRALDTLLRRHRILAASVLDGQVVIPPEDEIPGVEIEMWDLTALSADQARATSAERAARMMAGHRWEQGPQLQASVITTADTSTAEGVRAELLLAAHHLVVDAVSWSTIASDVRSVLDSPSAELAPLSSTEYRTWALRLAEFARSPSALRDRAYWRETLRRARASAAVAAIEEGRGAGAAHHAESPCDTRTRISLSAQDVASLRVSAPEGAARTEEVLLAAATCAAARTWGISEVPLLVETHGRPDRIAGLEDCAVAATVGWFTTTYPVVIVAGTGRALLRSVRDALRRVPNEGLTAELLYPGASRGAAIGVVNYLGEVVSGPGLNPYGGVSDPGNRETHAFAIDAFWQDEQLVLDLSLRVDLLGQGPAEQFVAELRAAVCALGADPETATALGAVPADLGVNTLTVAELETLPDDAAEVLSLTSLQTGLLFEHLASAEEAQREHLVQVSYRFDIPFDAQRIKATLASLVQLTPALRTTIHWEGLAQPHQVVHATASPVLRVHDLRDLGSTDGAKRADALARAARSRTFSLDEPGLFETDAVAMADHVLLVFTHHHIILDGWSLAELVRVFGLLYLGDAAVDPAPAPSVGAYLGWLREQDAEASRDYWAGVFAGLAGRTSVRSARGLVDVIADREPSAVVPGSGQVPGDGEPLRVERRTSRRLAARIASVLAPRGVSASMAVEGALATVLARMNGSQEAVYGVVVSGRDAPVPGIERMVGLLINTVLRRVRVPADATAKTLLSSIRDQALASAEFSFGALTDIHDVAGPDSAVECLFSFENYYSGAEDPGRAAPRLVGAVEQTSYPLTVTAETDGDELVLTAIRDSQVLAAADARRVLKRLEHVLESFVADPEALVAAAGTTREHALSQPDSALAHHDEPRGARDASLAAHLLRSAARHAPRRALVDAAGSLSYSELVARAQALASTVSAAVVEAGEAVAVADDGRGGLLGILGTCLASCAYVPLDLRTPPARARRMLDDAGVRRVLATTDEGHAYAEMVSGGEREVLDVRGALAEPAGAMSDGDELAAPTRHSGDELAYIMYTSGTTGVPKGVMVPHRAVLRLALDNPQLLPVPDDVVLMTSSLAFDASTFEIWGTLLNGASLIIPERGTVLDPEALRQEIRDQRVTVMWLTVSLFNEVVMVDPTVLRGLRLLLIGGERVSAAHVARAYDANPGLTIINGYGPTENTTFTTAYPIPHSVRAGDNVPIGAPLAGTSVLVRDEAGRTCDIGEPGELCAAGAGLALGYVNAPEATAERFRSGADGVGIFYHTGDRVRWLEDGTLEYLGRLLADTQVKIRGFRVETAEVETALRAVEGVRDAIVRSRTEANLSTALVGYVVAVPGHDLSAVREALRERLPDYMVPTYLVRVSRFPLTANGKIDTAALPEVGGEPGGDGCLTSAASVEDPALRCVLTAFAEALGRPVAPDENFFESGGDSIKAIHVVSVIRQHGYLVSVSAVMRTMTPRRIAETLEPAGNELTTLAELPAEGAVAPTPIVTEFLRWGLRSPDHFNQDLEIDLTGATTEQIREAVNAVWARHGALRACLAGGALFVRPRSASYIFEEHCVDDDESDEAVATHATRLHTALSLERGPLFGAVVVRTGSRARVVLVAHHLVVDSLSWRVIAEEVTRSVSARMGRAAPVAQRSSASLRAWAEAMQRQAGSVPAAQSRYWDAVDREASAALPMFSPTEASDERTAETERVLSVSDTENTVRAAVSAYGASAEDVVLAALARAVKQVMGQDRTAVRLERHGRSESTGLPATDRTVGWFTSMFPFVVDALDDPRDAVVVTKDRLRAVPDDGITYGLLPGGFARIKTPLTVNYLGDLGRSATGGFGQVVFNSAGTSVSEENRFLPGVRANVMIVDSRLVVRLSYETAVACAEQVERLTDAWAEEIVRLGGHCAHVRSRFWTAADFPQAVGLTPADLRGINMLPGAVEDVLELTPLQEGMLVHSLNGGTEYVIQHVYRVVDPLRSVLTPEVLTAAADTVAARHTALRYAVLGDGLSHPVQVVLQERTIPVRWDDWRSSAEAPAELVRRALADDVTRGFDLAGEPLLRLRVLRTSGPEGEELRLALTMHHIAVDGWSVSTLMGQLLDACRRLASGQEEDALRRAAVEKSRVTAQHRDYVRWIAEQDPEEFSRYWADLLAGYDGGARFSTAAGAAPASDGEVQADLDTGGVGRLETMTRSGLRRRLEQQYGQKGFTVSHLVHAAFGIVLARESGLNDVVFGSVVSGRDHAVAGVSEAVGLFINTIPVRIQLAHTTTVKDLVSAVRDAALRSASFSYGSLRAVEEAAGAQQLVTCLLAYENYESSDLTGSGLVLDQAREETGYSLSLAVSPVGDDLAVTALYDGAVLTAEDARRIVARMVLVLEQLASDPSMRVGAVRTVSDDEWHKVSRAFNGTAVDHDHHATVLDAFLAHAAAHPDDAAVIAGDKEYSYGQAAAAARSVAAAVAARAPRGARVGLLAERSPYTFVAMIGIMMAGCGFVPLDVASPASRVAALLDDAQPGLLLTLGVSAQQLAGRATEGRDVPTVALETCLDQQVPSVAEQDSLLAGRAPCPEDVAYCIYTSGSTGAPKAVVVAHSGLTNLRTHLRAVYAPGPSDRVLQFASMIFDASVWELTLSLLSGSTLVVVPEELIYETDRLEAEMRRTKVTLGLLPPHYYLQLGPVPMRVLTTGGAASSPAVVEKARREGVRYINAYGPTETTVLATGWEDPGHGAVPQRVPIGSPVANSQVFVVDLAGAEPRLCGVGEAGELCVAGEGVAQGYLGLSEETARAFVPNPFADGTLYRTGDRARWLQDGMLEFLGRIAESRQVKVRGFRIEVAEVEEGLRQVAAVRDAVVIPTTGADGADALTAYVVLADHGDIRSVRESLREILPGYMLPQHLVPIASVPLNRSGKLDVAALPDPSSVSAGKAEDSRVEMSADEQAVVDAFARVLLREQVGPDDNLFEVGGDSIKAIRIVSSLRSAGYSVTAADIMSAMTPRAIAPLLRRAMTPSASQGPVTGEVRPTPITEQFFSWHLAEPDHFNQDLLLEVGEGCRVTPMQAQEVLDEIWSHHDALRAVVRGERLVIRGTEEAGHLPLDVVDLDDTELDDVQRTRAEQAQRGLDLADGPLVRAVLLTSPARQRLLLVGHHLVVDLVSWHVIVEDLRSALEQVVAGGRIALPPKTASVIDWADALHAYTTTQAVETVRYWRQVHQDLPAADLRAGTEGARGVSASQQLARFTLDADDTSALLDVGVRAYACSVEDLLLTSIGYAAQHLTGCTRLSARLESHGRFQHPSLPAVDRTVGWFTSAYPVVFDILEDVPACILRVRDTVRSVPDLGLGYSSAVGDDTPQNITLTVNYLGVNNPGGEDPVRGRVWLNESGTSSAEENTTFGGIAVVAWVACDRIHVRVAAEARVTTHEWFAQLVGSVRAQLTDLAAHCRAQNSVHRTTADFAAADITDEDLDVLDQLFG